MIHITLRRWPYLQWRQESVSSKTIGWLALAVTIIAGSTYNAFGKVLTGSLSPVSLFFVSEFLTGFFVIVSFGFMPMIQQCLQLNPKKLLPLLFIGLTNGTIGPILLFAGLQSSTAVNSSLFTNMESVFLVMLAVIILREPFRREHVLSSLTIVAGILIIALRGFTAGLHFYWGDMLLILSSLSFALGGLIFRRSLHDMNPHIVLFFRAIVGITFFILLTAFMQHHIFEEIRAFPLAMLPVLVGFGFISRFLNTFSFYEALDRLPVTTVSLVSNVTIITSILFAWWMLGEPILGYHILGGGLIILGTILLEVIGIHRSPAELEGHSRTRGPRA